MTEPRSLGLRDLPRLARARGQAVPLDTTRLLTRGNPLDAAGLLAYMDVRRHVYSALAAENGIALLGGISHRPGENHAQLSYLAPKDQLDHPHLPVLIEHLTGQAGKWGAFHLLAELEEDSIGFAPLRRAGFSLYASQRIWDASSVTGSASEFKWQRTRSVDLPAVQSLHAQIVPPLLQPIEPAPREPVGYFSNSGGHAFAIVISGPAGTVIQPLIHPDTSEPGARLLTLIRQVAGHSKLPVYVCMRTYQAWLGQPLEGIGAKPGPRQAVMVRHLARMIKEGHPVRAAQPAHISVQPSRIVGKRPQS